jgi:hypothetical protein
LVAYHEGRDLIYAGRIRAGLWGIETSAAVSELRIEHCPFRNLPERIRGRWGEGLTAEDKAKCRWLRDASSPWGFLHSYLREG